MVSALVGPVAGACGSDAESPPSSEAGIGPAGGTVRVQGLELQVPRGALSRVTSIRIEPATGLDAADGQELVAAFELSPSGLVFDIPATARAAYSRGGGEPRLFTSTDGAAWSPLPDSRYDARGGLVTGSVLHFSFLSVQVAPLAAGAGGATGGEAGSPHGGGSTAEGGIGVVGGGQGLGGAGSPGVVGGGQGGGAGVQSGGAGGEGGGAGQGGTGAVTCSTAGGLGPPPCAGELSCDHGSSAVSTETNWSSCSDGHDYTIRCSGSGDTCSCTCLVDSVKKGSCTYAMQACDGAPFQRCTCPTFPRLTIKN